MSASEAMTPAEISNAMLTALQTTAGNIRSLGPAGALSALPECYRAWLATVESAIALAEQGGAAP